MNFEYEILGITFNTRWELALTLTFLSLTAKFLAAAIFKSYLVRGKDNEIH